jgi:hypothetical protein
MGKTRKNKENINTSKNNKTQKRRRVPSLKTKCGYIPKKYFGSKLTKKEKKERIDQICKGKKSDTNDSKAYKKWKTDDKKKTRTSSYNVQFYSLYPELKDVKGNYFKLREEKTGFPADLLKIAFNKGKAAWRTGHRPGATAEQWGYARVSSLLMKGKTFTGSGKRPVGADYHLYEDALKRLSKDNKKSKQQKKKLRAHYRMVDKFLK